MSVNIISLNQIISLFKDFSDRHYFINDFGYGPTSDIGTSRQMEFPYMWVTTTQDSVINPQNKTAIPDLSFVVLFMDKTNNQDNYLNINGVNSNNVQEILSDQFQTLQDFITEIQVNFGNYGLSLVDVVRCYPGIDETQDSVNGWIGEFTLRVKHSNCILPTGEIVQTNLTPINPTTRYLTCDTLSNCQVIQDIQNEIDNITGGTSQNLHSVLTVGNETGGENIVITDGDNIETPSGFKFMNLSDINGLQIGIDNTNPSADYYGVIQIDRGDSGGTADVSLISASVNTPEQSGLLVQTGLARISSSNDGDYTIFGITPTNAEILGTDSLFAGIEYNSDYSSNYTNRSLVDKEYVDNQISNLPGVAKTYQGEYNIPPNTLTIITHNLNNQFPSITIYKSDPDYGWVLVQNFSGFIGNFTSNTFMVLQQDYTDYYDFKFTVIA